MTKEDYNANKHQTSHTGNVGSGNVGSGNVGVGSSTPPPPPPPPPAATGPVVSDDRDEADYGSNPH